MATPLGIVISLVLAILVFCLPRRMAAVAVIAAVCYVTEGLPLDFAGFHFTAIRFVLLAGFIRLIARGELNQLRFNPIDKSVFTLSVIVLVISTLRVGTGTELIYQIGVLYNVLLSYIVFRCFLRDERDLREVLGNLAFAIVPIAFIIINESVTNRNLFAVFGAVSEVDMIRDGHIRSQGPFRSPITLGAFGATFALFYATMLFAKGPRTRSALVGVIASTMIVLCSHSSGPLLGTVIGLLAMACWRVRRHVSKIRWALAATLVGLNMVMKVPVWFLIGRISDIVGGGGYHRAYLIDQFVRHFSDWWLMGTSNTGDWMPTQLESGGSDLTNKFVSDGVNGGLVGLILSVALIVRCFRRVGLALKARRGEKSTEKMLWGIGSALVGTIGIFFSVTYFDQMYVIWYFLLACIAGVDIAKKKLPVHPTEEPARKVRHPAVAVSF